MWEPSIGEFLAGGIGPMVLIVARCGGIAATAPGWATPGLGWRFRVGLTGMLALVAAPVVGGNLPTELASSPCVLGRELVTEAAIGAALGMLMGLVIAGARQAGDLVGAQAGLATASLYDPEAGDGLTPLGHLYGLVALGTFLSVGGPLRLVGVLVESYRAIPVGGAPLSDETARWCFARVGWALGLSLRAAAPIAVALIAAGLALGLVGKLAGGLGLSSLTWPVRSAAGVFLAMLGLAAVAGLFAGAWRTLLP
jgi:flagellar biosynthetic protein FliR